MIFKLYQYPDYSIVPSMIKKLQKLACCMMNKNHILCMIKVRLLPSSGRNTCTFIQCIILLYTLFIYSIKHYLIFVNDNHKYTMFKLRLGTVMWIQALFLLCSYAWFILLLSVFICFYKYECSPETLAHEIVLYAIFQAFQSPHNLITF